MKNIIILLLYLPFLIYSQNVSSYDELMRAREKLNQDRLDLEDWYVKQSVEFYFIISFKEGVDIDKWIQDHVPSKIQDRINKGYGGGQEILFLEEYGDIIEGSLDLDNDAQVEDYWWDESEEDEINNVYFEELEEIEVSFQAINTYLRLKNIQDNDIYYDHHIPFDTLTTIWSWDGLLVECDSFGMEKWIGNWISEGVQPGEASVYENWYIVFNIVSDAATLYLPLVIEHCDYNESENVMMCGEQEIKIGNEYIIRNISTELGERGNGIIFVTQDIEEWSGERFRS